MKQSDYNRAARKIARANAALWDAIGLINEALSDPVISKLLEEHDNDKQKLFEKLATAYEKINKKYDGFIDAGMHGRDIDDFDNFTTKFAEVLETE
jgi:arsenate reductase-like glutaredoxin family protein